MHESSWNYECLRLLTFSSYPDENRTLRQQLHDANRAFAVSSSQVDLALDWQDRAPVRDRCADDKVESSAVRFS